jgi:hypothetical protein
MVTVAVSDVPSPFTTMFEAVTFESMAPALVINFTPVTPNRFTPVIVMVKFVLCDPEAGERDCMYGPFVNETLGLVDPKTSVGDARLTDTEADVGAEEIVGEFFRMETEAAVIPETTVAAFFRIDTCGAGTADAIKARRTDIEWPMTASA